MMNRATADVSALRAFGLPKNWGQAGERGSKLWQGSIFPVIARGATRKGFPEPEVSAYEQPPTQPPRQRLSLDGLPGKC